MRYTITFLDKAYKGLIEHLFNDKTKEQVAYLLCGISRSSGEVRLLVREIIPVPSDALLIQEEDLLSIPSSSYVPVLKRAADIKQCFFLVHSHPKHIPQFSRADDLEEPKLFKTAYVRFEDGIHGSLVFSSPDNISARVWLEKENDLVASPIHLIRILGEGYRFIVPNNAPKEGNKIPEKFFERQVRAFGKDLQKLLGSMHIGVVGCGGTGSAVIEQLARLGVGALTLVDDDGIEDTNISRIHGSTMRHFTESWNKAYVMNEMIKQIGFGTKVKVIAKKLLYESVARELRDCDLIFGCTDDDAGRAIINLLSIYYYIPVIDMGVLIDSRNGSIHNILGRVTMIKPGGPCLYCRNHIDAGRVAAEMMNPELYRERLNEGYAPELGIKDPSVITFTTAVACQAVIEMLNLFSGFVDKSHITELVCRFDSRAMSLRPNPRGNCICSNQDKVGRGDYLEFLGINWPPEKEVDN